MKLSHALLSAALLVSGLALAEGEQGQAAQSESLKMMVPAQEQQFAQRLHHANQLEVRLGQLAEQKAENPQVKEFAKKMVQDHQKADEALMTFARTQKWNLQKEPKPANKLERAMDAAEKADEAKFKQLDGAAFDSAYMAHMVADHDLDIMKVTHAAKQFRGTEFAAQLEQLTPTLMQHRDEAQRILGQLKPQMGVGGAGDMGMPMPDTQERMQEGMPHEGMPHQGMQQQPEPKEPDPQAE